MLQKSQTKRINQLKYVLLLPLVAVFLYSFNIKEVYLQKDTNHLNYQNKTIVIDVSHGGNDLGTSINGYSEKEIVLAISKKIADAYKGNASIIFTRNDDEFVSLNDRVSQINAKNPDLVISLHINNAKDVRENGVAAYVSEKNSQFKQSKEVASLLLNNLTGIYLKNNGISKANLKINSDVNCPSVTLELGYLSNKMDRAYLTSYNGQQEIAQKIIDFISGKQVLANKINFILPIDKDNIISISGYGMRVHPITKKKEFHKGVDFKAYNRMDVYAVASGSVTDTGYDDEKGYFITIEHKNGFVTKYHHLGNVQIGKGDIVSPGEIIGIIGSTGKSIAPHLHFELLKDGKNVNPMDYLYNFQVQNIKKNKKNQKSISKKSTKLKQSIKENINKLTRTEKAAVPPNSGWIFYDKKTYYYKVVKNIISFYTRYGDDVVYDISLELLNKINKEQKTNLELEQNETGFINYDRKTYFYSKKGALIFYDKYGNEVDSILKTKLLNVITKNQEKENKVIIKKVIKMALQKTTENKLLKFIVVNGVKLTIDEALKINEIKSFRINPIINKNVKVGREIEINETNNKSYSKIEEEKDYVNLGWVFYETEIHDNKGYYYNKGNEMLFFNENGTKMETNKVKQLVELLK